MNANNIAARANRDARLAVVTMGDTEARPIEVDALQPVLCTPGVAVATGVAAAYVVADGDNPARFLGATTPKRAS